MPRFLDIHHHASGLTREQVAAAHAKDLAVQGKHGVSFVRYWYDEVTGKIFPARATARPRRSVSTSRTDE